jgi:hypothetical protein
MYEVSYFDSIGWAKEVVGYYSSKEKAEAAIAACGAPIQFDIRRIAVDMPIDADSIYIPDEDDEF